MNRTICVVDVETTGLNPMQDRIVAVGMKTDKNTAIFSGEDEKFILEQFWNFLQNNKVEVLVGFNFDFDWQFLKLRSLKHRIKIRHYQKYKERYDLRAILNPDRYQKGTRLRDYLEFLGIPNGDEFDGSMIPKFFEEGKFDEIEDHLEHDINSTYELYKILVECGVIS